MNSVLQVLANNRELDYVRLANNPILDIHVTGPIHTTSWVGKPPSYPITGHNLPHSHHFLDETCFMSSVLHVLTNTRELKDYILGIYKADYPIL